MSHNIYYNPEKFGAIPVGEVEYSFGSYEFDTTVLWKIGNQFYIGSDSGCSCPTPFDYIGVDDLTEVKSIQDLKTWFASREHDYYSDYEKEQIAMQETELISRYVGAK